MEDLNEFEKRFLKYHTISPDQLSLVRSDPDYFNKYMVGVRREWVRVNGHTVLVCSPSDIKSLFYNRCIVGTLRHETYRAILCYQLVRKCVNTNSKTIRSWCIEFLTYVYVRVKLDHTSVCGLPIHIYSVGEYPIEMDPDITRPMYFSPYSPNHMKILLGQTGYAYWNNKNFVRHDCPTTYDEDGNEIWDTDDVIPSLGNACN